MELAGEKILLGLSGGIAAYKAPLLVRALMGAGARVRVVPTAAAQRFVAPKALEVLSRHRVYLDLFEASEEFPVLHLGLAAWADLVLVAPATAHTIAKMAHGLADDLLSTLLLSTRAPVVVAPSMEERMLEHPAVERNMALLRQRGVWCIEPEEGELASGTCGRGRLPAPETLVACLVEHLAARCDLQGLRLLVTAGPTVEDIDPVRFISNRSSGKMGYALAQRARARGARVWLVSGPTALAPPAGVEVRRVRTALEMEAALEKLFDEVDAALLAAAVADYRAAEVAAQKLKRGAGGRVLELVENPDIAAGLGRRKTRQILVGFAMETSRDLARAREKLERKNCDLIALNNLRQEGAGFGADTNVVTLIEACGRVQALPKMSKLEVADRILDRVRDLCGARA